jgi:hypothetical protein
LLAERLLRAAESGASRSLECYHDKIRESLVQSLSAERQRALHASLLGVLIECADADPEHLALHARAAGDSQAAVRYALRAAEAASAAMAFEQAAVLYASVLSVGQHDAAVRSELGSKLGEALANAGRGADAARVYLDSASGAGELQALDLKRRAAEQLLISGHIDSGKQLLGEVLRPQGLALPRSANTALLSLVRERALLRLRGLRPRESKPPPRLEKLRELAVLWSASRGLAGVDMWTGAALSSRYARHALDSGSLEHAARALGSEAWFASTASGPGSRPYVADLLERAHSLAIASGRPEARAWVQLNRALTLFMQGDFARCKTDCADVLQTLRENCTDVSFEVCTAHVFGLIAGTIMGELAPSSELAALVDDAWRRGDLRAAILLTSAGANARLVRGDAAELERHLLQARERYQRPRSFGWLDLNLLFAELWHAVYVAEFERGLERLQAEWSVLQKSRLMHAPLRGALLRGLRGTLAAGVARLGKANATSMRALAARDAQALARERLPLPAAMGSCLEAGLAIDRGELARPLAQVSSALRVFEDAGYVLPVHALRRCIGQLQRGPAGAELVNRAELAFSQLGVVDLAATARLFAFGVLPK